MKAELNRFPFLTLQATSTTAPTAPDSGHARLYIRSDGSVAVVNSAGAVSLFAKSTDLAALSTTDRSRSNHTGTQAASTIADFSQAARAVIASTILAGTNVTKTVDATTGTVTISSDGGSGESGTGLDSEAVQDVVSTLIYGSGNIQVAYDDTLNRLTITTTATANSTDAQLRDRGTHTGTQAISTVSGLQAALDSLQSGGSAVSLDDLYDVRAEIREDGSVLQWVSEADEFRTGPIDLSKYPADPRYPLATDIPDLTYFRPINVLTSPTDVTPADWPVGGVTLDLRNPARGLTEGINIVAAATGAITLPPPSTATVHDLTLSGNVTLTPPPAVGGQSFKVSIRNAATGGPYTVTWATGFNWSDATSNAAPALATGASAVTELYFESTRGAAWGNHRTVRFAGGTVAGATPTYTSSVKASTGASNSLTSLGLVLPAPITSGQIMYMGVAVSGTTANLSTPTGWTLLSGPDGTNAIRGYLFVRVMDGTEDGTTVTLTTDIAARINAVAALISGGTRTNEVLATPAVDTSTEAPPTIDVPSVTPLVANSLLVNIAAIRYQNLTVAPAITPSTDWTEREDFYEARALTTTVQFGGFLQTKALTGQANVAQAATTAVSNQDVTEVSWVIAVPPPVA